MQNPFKSPPLRWRYLINPGVQLRLFLYLWLPLLLFYLLTVYLLAQVFTPLHNQILQTPYSPQNPLLEHLISFKTYATWVFIIIGIFSTLGFFFLTLFISHRIVGPIDKIIEYLNTQSNSDTTESFRLRKDDFLIKEVHKIYEIFK